ncbi:TfuA-like protein [Kitasatospora purpeofusca]|uniref:TfuA-like protein n=1 Tax=Kitasatospora purpeofusca TaxID=67352 RepID=UPI0036D28A1F
MTEAPSVCVHPPVRHGDLRDLAIGDGDTVVIIDGLYHQTPALRHKEILAAMGRGVSVVGAASIGALRAAELQPFGMAGVGAVFRAYMDGEIDGDDEVAVGQEPGGRQRALTWPLVNLRHVLRIARAEGVADARTCTGLLESLRAVYYPQRSTAAVLAVLRREGAAHLGEWLRERRVGDPYFGDLKRLDALQAISAAVSGAFPPALGRVPAGVWDTGYHRRWVNETVTEDIDALTLAAADRLAYQQLFDPGFPGRWTAFLEHRSRHPGGAEGPGRPLAERLARLAGDDDGVPPVYAVFRPVLDLTDRQTVGLLLAGETAADRATIARYAARNAEAARAHPGFRPEAVVDAAARGVLLQLWQTGPESLDGEALSRGLGSGQHAVEALKTFLMGFLVDARAARLVEVADAR